MTFLSFSHLPESTGPMSPRKEAENEKGGMKKAMKKLAVLALLFMLVIPVLPLALAEDSTANVDIGIGADTVNLNVTCTTSTGGTVDISVNGVDVEKTVIINAYYQWDYNYLVDIQLLNWRIDETQYNLIALANYTDGKLSMLLTNDNYLVKWIGCLDITTPIGKRIFDGNSTVVMELDRLDTQLMKDNAMLTDMITRLTIVIGQIDSRLATETYERKKAEEEVRGLIAKLQSESATKRDLEITNRNLMDTTNELLNIKAQFEQMRLILMAVGAIVVGLGIAWIAGSTKE